MEVQRAARDTAGQAGRGRGRGGRARGRPGRGRGAHGADDATAFILATREKEMREAQATVARLKELAGMQHRLVRCGLARADVTAVCGPGPGGLARAIQSDDSTMRKEAQDRVRYAYQQMAFIPFPAVSHEDRADYKGLLDALRADPA